MGKMELRGNENKNRNRTQSQICWKDEGIMQRNFDDLKNYGLICLFVSEIDVEIREKGLKIRIIMIKRKQLKRGKWNQYKKVKGKNNKEFCD